MDIRCCVLGCSKTSGDKVKLHEFPLGDDSLLPVWITATNRHNWTPTVQSRMCDQHFNVDSYEDGHKNNKLKPNACPILAAPTGTVGDDDTMSDSSTSDVRMSEIGLGDTTSVNSTDMNLSDEDSDISLTDSNWNETSGIDDDDYQSSLSEDEFDDIESAPDFDAESLCSAVDIFDQKEQFINDECAVALCNENIRNQSDSLFFVGFPIDNLSLCEVWWKLCGRSGQFNPSFKICSIHFDTTDFVTIIEEHEDQVFRRTLLKSFNTVPTMFLMSHEFTQFSSRKRKISTGNNDVLETKTKLKKCAVQNCSKMFLKDSKNKLFFSFPLEKKNLLRKWLDSIKLSNWQPSEADKICSDHFESHHIIKINNNYKLKNYAFPSINPKKPFVLNYDSFYKKSVVNNLTLNSLEFNKLDDRALSYNNDEYIKRRQIKNRINLVPMNDLYRKRKLQNEAVTAQSSSSEKKLNEENQLSYSSTNFKESVVECSIVDSIMDSVNSSEDLQPKSNNTESLAKKNLESFEKEIAKEKKGEDLSNNDNLEYVSFDILNDDAVKVPPVVTNGCFKIETSKQNKPDAASNINLKYINSSSKLSTVPTLENSTDTFKASELVNNLTKTKSKITEDEISMKNKMEATSNTNLKYIDGSSKLSTVPSLENSIVTIKALELVNNLTKTKSKITEDEISKQNIPEAALNTNFKNIYSFSKLSTVPTLKNSIGTFKVSELVNNLTKTKSKITEDEISKQNKPEVALNTNLKYINSSSKLSTVPSLENSVVIIKASEVNNLTETKSKITEDEISMRNKPEVALNTNLKNINSFSKLSTIPTLDNSTGTFKASELVNNLTKTKLKIIEVKNLIPKSKNNGNESDYVYLDTLNDDDVGEFLAFEKKCTSNNSNNKLPELVEKIPTKEIPRSIINNEALIESYGEMLLPICEIGCQELCNYAIPGPQRRYIFNEFHSLDSVTEQNCKIAQLIQLRLIKKEDNTFESYPSYYLIMNSKSVKVCRLFFMNTLGIPESRLDAILNPTHYSWFSNKESALKARQPKQVKVIKEPMVITDFVKESLKPLKKDYNLYESESDSEVSLDNVPTKEYKKVFLYMKSIPRVLSSYNKNSKNLSFETSINLDFMYKSYSENYIKNKVPPPYTKRQFRKIYNQYMKTFLTHV